MLPLPNQPRPSTPSPTPSPSPAAQPSHPPAASNPVHDSSVTPEVCDDLHNMSKSIEGMDADEQLVCVIHRHIIGLLGIYFGAGLALICIVGGMAFLLPQLANISALASLQSLVAVLVLIVSALVAIGVVIATYVYQRCILIITSKNVTQIIQRSLFSRKVSELSLSNVEDVSADKRGILQTLFNYGTLNIQTAGELENFMFIYCPRPSYFGRIVLDARQAYADSLKEKVGE